MKLMARYLHPVVPCQCNIYILDGRRNLAMMEYILKSLSTSGYHETGEWETC